jgi:hypothetical protein
MWQPHNIAWQAALTHQIVQQFKLEWDKLAAPRVVVALREDVELMDKRPAERCLFNKG